MTCEWIRHENKENVGVLVTKQTVCHLFSGENMNRMEKQLLRIGFRYDNSEVPVRDPSRNVI